MLVRNLLLRAISLLRSIRTFLSSADLWIAVAGLGWAIFFVIWRIFQGPVNNLLLKDLPYKDSVTNLFQVGIGLISVLLLALILLVKQLGETGFGELRASAEGGFETTGRRLDDVMHEVTNLYLDTRVLERYFLRQEAALTNSVLPSSHASRQAMEELDRLRGRFLEQASLLRDGQLPINDRDELRGIFERWVENSEHVEVEEPLINKLVILDPVPGPFRSKVDKAAFGRLKDFADILYKAQDKRRSTGHAIQVSRYYLIHKDQRGELYAGKVLTEALFESWTWKEEQSHFLVLVDSHTPSIPERTIILGLRSQVDTEDIVFRIEIPSAIGGSKVANGRLFLSYDQNREAYDRLKPFVNSGLLLERTWLANALVDGNPDRFGAFGAIRRYWKQVRESGGIIFAVDLSMLGDDFDRWANDSFYQVVLEENGEIIKAWDARRRRDTKKGQFTRVFVLSDQLVGDLDFSPERRNEFMRVVRDQLDRGIDVRFVLIDSLRKNKNLGDDTHQVADFNYVDGVGAVSLHVTGSGDNYTVHPSIYKSYEPGSPEYDAFRKYYTAFVENNALAASQQVIGKRFLRQSSRHIVDPSEFDSALHQALSDMVRSPRT